MRKIFVVALMAMMVIFSGYAHVNAEPKPKPGITADSGEPVLTAEEIKQIRTQLKDISDLVSGRKETAAPKAKEEAEEPQKNMADVADKALSLLSGYIGIVAGAMTKVAPEVWRIMVRQQYANAVAGPFVPFMLIMILAVYGVVMSYWWDKAKVKEESNEAGARGFFVNLVPFVLFIIFGIWTSVQLSYSVQMLINPEYYAFRDLVHILLNKGGL